MTSQLSYIHWKSNKMCLDEKSASLLKRDSMVLFEIPEQSRGMLSVEKRHTAEINLLNSRVLNKGNENSYKGIPSVANTTI